MSLYQAVKSCTTNYVLRDDRLPKKGSLAEAGKRLYVSLDPAEEVPWQFFIAALLAASVVVKGRLIYWRVAVKLTACRQIFWCREVLERERICLKQDKIQSIR